MSDGGSIFPEDLTDWLNSRPEGRQAYLERIVRRDQARTEKDAPPPNFGPWRVKRLLGKGGNAKVWLVKHETTEAEAAVKCIIRPSGTGLQRFLDEIHALDTLAGTPGIISPSDRYIPVPDSGQDAWMVLPRAKKIDRVVSVEMIVERAAELLETLTVVHDKQFSHRDIKPDNILEFGGRWVLCDFGLVSFPEKLDMTTEKLGPMHYLAPEMLTSAKSALGAPADIYSFGKTIWVLLTGQALPLPGEQPMDSRHCQLQSWIGHARIHLLNSLLDRMTRHDPNQRPSAKFAAEELRVWLTPIGANVDTPFPDRSQQFKAITSPLEQRNKREAELREQILKIHNDWWKAIEPDAARAMRSIGLPFADLNYSRKLEEELAIPFIGWGNPLVSFCRGFEVKAPRDAGTLLVGIYVAFHPSVKEEERLVLGAAHLVDSAMKTIGPGYNFRPLALQAKTQINTPLMEQALHQMTKQFITSLPGALDEFEKAIEIGQRHVR